MQTEWRAVFGYEGVYEVSDAGDVRRCGAAKPLKPSPAGAGYFVVSLSVNGRAKKRYIAHLVMEAFAGPVPLGSHRFDTQVNHKSGDKSNNAFGNLEYLTQVENKAHAVRSDLT